VPKGGFNSGSCPCPAFARGRGQCKAPGQPYTGQWLGETRGAAQKAAKHGKREQRVNRLVERLGIALPVIQAPMAGTGTPALAAAVSNAGGLGSIALGAGTPEAGRDQISATRAATDRPFNVNLFCHAPPRRDAAREQGWIARLAPLFEGFGAAPPDRLGEIYRSFVEDGEMLDMLVEERPAVISFHFGLPPPDRVAQLRAAGIELVATATSLSEGQAVVGAGISIVVAQGYEAGGHRGQFDPDAPDPCLGTLALTRLLARALPAEIVAAGGIMDGAGIAAALALGAGAAQLGTAFIACAESAADEAFRRALFSEAAHRTMVTRAISGRRARCLANRFTALGATVPDEAIPDYPVAYDAGKALNQAAKAGGEGGYGAQWAGQGAPLARAMPAARLVETLAAELDDARAERDRGQPESSFRRKPGSPF
jgi:nitronate monooxygenase